MIDIPDWYKLEHGKSIDELERELPTLDGLIKKAVSGLKTGYDTRTLGYSDSGEEFITEEERYVNFHILGAPGEGKSKFLEYHIRRDIDLGNGLCLLDPSDKGDTARNVLNYCAKKNYKKVVWIDPETISKYGKIPAIAPLSAKSVKQSASGVMESLNILFDAKSTATPRIRHYLSALLRILAASNLTLRDTKYFSKYEKYKKHREAIYALDGDPDDVETLREIFASPHLWREYFASSIHRIGDIWQEHLASILGNTEGINFKRVIGDGWVVLVNLSLYQLTKDESRLLGILILSQIVQAMDALVNNNWQGIFYLYIDEVGSFVTPQIQEMLQQKRKSGLRMYLAHHDYLQFKGKEEIASAIEGSARIKLMFNVANYEDRMRMIKSLGYGGNIPHALAAYANSDLPKQYAVLKKNKESPVRIRIPDVEEVPAAPEEYIKEILSQSFYKDVRSIRENTESAQLGEVDDAEITRQTSLPRSAQGELEKGVRPDNKKPSEPPPKRPIEI